MSLLTIWILIGTGLLVVEVLTGSFVLLFFSLGAFSAALLSLYVSLEMQILASGIISVLGLLVLRKPLQKRVFQSSKSLHIDLGQTLRADVSISRGETARLAYQGTTWQARNEGDHDISAGDTVQIAGTDGNILLVKK